MPRYFLHVHDDVVAMDEEGSEFPDLDAAREAARDGARDLVCAQIRAGWLNLDHYIELGDEEGRVLETVRFRDAFEIKGG